MGHATTHEDHDMDTLQKAISDIQLTIWDGVDISGDCCLSSCLSYNTCTTFRNKALIVDRDMAISGIRRFDRPLITIMMHDATPCPVVWWYDWSKICMHGLGWVNHVRWPRGWCSWNPRIDCWTTCEHVLPVLRGALQPPWYWTLFSLCKCHISGPGSCKVVTKIWHIDAVKRTAQGRHKDTVK